MNKLLTSTAAAALLSASVCVNAQELEGVYLGGAASGYFLDNERFLEDEDDDAAVLGVNLGYRFANPLAVEIGYGTSVSGEDVDAFKIDGFYYINDIGSGWKPYFVLGYTQFSFDEDEVLSDGDDSTGQMDVGFGFAKTWDNSQWEFRGDGRFLERMGNGDQATDLAVNLAVNYYFTKPAVPVAPASEPAPAPPETRTITVKLNVEFEYNKADVLAIYGDELTAVANAMKAHDDILLQLEGHTDSSGSDEYNQGLSQRRVEAVKARLTADYGIPASRISTVGYGESRPIADNGTDEGRARNRRVVGELNYTEVVGD